MLALPPVLTQTQATHSLKVLLQGMQSEAGQTVVVNASALTQFDSAALAVLLEFRREALGSGKRFAVQGMPARLGDLATLYGVIDLLPVVAPAH